MDSTAILMRGSELAGLINADTSARAAKLVEHHGIRPTLATVLVGDDPASRTYVDMKQKRCYQLGLSTRQTTLAGNVSTSELVDVITELSSDDSVHGILLQHPVPEHIDERAAFDAIAVTKDVDGVTSGSFAAMSLGAPGYVSCTPGGIIRLLDHYEVELAGRHAVVVGRSPILGKPMAALLLARDATVTVCHSHTTDLAKHLADADLVIAAAGRPHLISGEDLKRGSVIVDAGYNAGNVGDVDFATAAQQASLITPVPGGVGPMTVATLLAQTVDSAEECHSRDSQVRPSSGGPTRLKPQTDPRKKRCVDRS